MAFHQLLTFVLISVLVSLSLSDDIPPNIKTWCSQTPYPQYCEDYMAHDSRSSGLKSHSDFKKLAMQITLDQAIQAKSNNRLHEPKFSNGREKAAWADCTELYQNTIARLNLTVNPCAMCTDYDVQTWLSTALTNLETCRTSVMELGVSDNIFSLVSNNVSNLIINALAINKPPPKEETFDDGFPTWASPRDRKLLQMERTSLAWKADLVVAQDGSGNFKTVSEAINEVAKWNPSGVGPGRRHVVHMKAGIYQEHMQVYTPNMMFTGDGIGKTVITGSMSVGGGATTFNSATIGEFNQLNFL
uniref:Pectinesterase inhibitor domain-containing protein n=1 Tax=Nelumbo nucifera TaxID=4432 RepID=A0A822XXE3_NELNU|nr:TPA_asm: hypothetical protein HUJ06_025847 [Nelumbo nucifera]